MPSCPLDDDDGWVARIEEMLGDLTRLIDGPAVQLAETANRLPALGNQSVARRSVRDVDHANERPSIDATRADGGGADTSDT